MRDKQETSIGALWALTWRAVLMLPVVTIFSGILLATFGLLIVLLPLGLARLWAGELMRGGLAIMAWIAIFFAGRRFRFWRVLRE